MTSIEKIQKIISQTKSKKKKELNLSYLELTSIPEEVFEMDYLHTLYLRGNNIAEIPPKLSSLKHIEDLDLSKNNLKVFPIEILAMSKLKILELDDNQIEVIPDEIDQLGELCGLYVNRNKLKKIPKSIAELTHLTRLEISGNQLKTIPGDIVLNLNLKRFLLNNNPLESPPPEIINQGIDSIENYFQELKDEGRDYIYEAKLLIVGEGGAGKTTLAKKLINPDYKLTNEDTTRGIEVSTLKFEINNEGIEKNEFKINIWDFGGQEIYHSTHQFFLTKRSLYTLVTDTRNEDTDFNYWLNVVELLSVNSPVIIILNEKQNRKKRINISKLRGQFSNLEAILPCNFLDNRGVGEILDLIKHHVQRLPHIGTALPKTWIKIRKVLEEDSRNYISEQEYIDLCAQNGIEDEEMALSVSEYLHDLGVFLHFLEHPILKNVIILKPEWSTNAVYKLIDSPQLYYKKGRLSKLEIEQIWNTPEYRRMHIELLALMEKFELCYPVENKDEYIIPVLLSPDTPEYEWNNNDNIHFRFKYGFMPKGIITRFITKTFRHIINQNLVWREGVILKYHDAVAEVTEWYEHKEIRIRISGIQKRDMLSILIEKLDGIHETFPRQLNIEKLIPCICKECQKSVEPYFFKYENLKRRLSKGKEKVECEISFDEIWVKQLIDDFPLKHSGKMEMKKEFITGDLKEIITGLMEKHQKDKSIVNELLLHMLNYNRLEKEERRNIIGTDELTRQKQKLYGSILEIMDDLYPNQD